MDTPEEEAIWNVPGMIAKEADRHTVSTLYTSSASLGGGNGRICPATPLGLKRALQSPRSSQQQSKSMESTRSDWDPSSSSSSHGNTTRKSALLLNNKSKQPSDALLLIDTMEEEQSEIEVIPNRRYPRDSSSSAGVVSGRPRGLQHFRSCVKFLYD
uniref:Uncharacterized protein n=1 Tax=Entomoneis paludosa TaxID=265537 RepID=A0A7S2YLU0_9STRA|mmetsp:Transcript_37875/g.78648  ORF Transcript_37875/g.78648 Transcript_37875/m.78648 type:complete len:157 (+) Transcript_37875:1-471(+)